MQNFTQVQHEQYRYLKFQHFRLNHEISGWKKSDRGIYRGKHIYRIIARLGAPLCGRMHVCFSMNFRLQKIILRKHKTVHFNEACNLNPNKYSDKGVPKSVFVMQRQGDPSRLIRVMQTMIYMSRPQPYISLVKTFN